MPKLKPEQTKLCMSIWRDTETRAIRLSLWLTHAAGPSTLWADILPPSSSTNKVAEVLGGASIKVELLGLSYTMSKKDQQNIQKLVDQEATSLNRDQIRKY